MGLGTSKVFKAGKKIVSQIDKEKVIDIGKTAANVGKKTAHNSKNIINKVDKVFMKPDKSGKNFNNLFTGKKMKPLVSLGIGTAIVGTGIAMGSKEGEFQDYVIDGRVPTGLNPLSTNLKRPVPQPINPLPLENPSMLADGLASSADTLGTSGNMVFGMHNSRQGGYI